MCVDDLAARRRAHVHVTAEASVLGIGNAGGKMLLPVSVAPHAKLGALDRAETEAMLVVVTRRAETTTEISGRGIADEASSRRRRNRESVLAERRPRGPVVAQRALKSAGEMSAGEGLLVLGLMAAPALTVRNGLRKVRMSRGRVALPAANALGGVPTLGVVGGDRPRVARRAGLDVGRGPGDCLGVRPIGPPREQDAARGQRGHQQYPESGDHDIAPVLRFHNRKRSSPCARAWDIGPWPDGLGF
jgi:hypothetical protein